MTHHPAHLSDNGSAGKKKAPRGGFAVRFLILCRTLSSQIAFASSRLLALVLLPLIILFSTLIVYRTDRIMRRDLLQQARLIAQVLDVSQVRSLHGHPDDMQQPAFEQLYTHLSRMRQTINARYVYLMGRKIGDEPGTAPQVFFFLDTQDELKEITPPSQPGDLYADASPELIAMFDRNVAFVEGPLPDQWGLWISALVPIVDPADDHLLAVLGVDLDARSWYWQLAARTAPPIGALLLLLIGILVLHNTYGPRALSDRPVLYRLLPPLAIMLVLLLAGGFALLWWQNRNVMYYRVIAGRENILMAIREDLRAETIELSRCLDAIVTDPRVPPALKANDFDHLHQRWKKSFAKMQDALNLSRWSFFDRNQVCQLRMHAPDQHGDTVTRFTLREAVRTGTTASGLEIGSNGSLVLRCVQPVKLQNEIVGYAELGKELDSILRKKHIRTGMHLTIAIRKSFLDREQWESAMRAHGRETAWNRLPEHALTYASQGYLPQPFTPSLLASTSPAQNDQTGKTILHDGKQWQVLASPIYDAAVVEVGTLLMMIDMTADKQAFSRIILLGGIGSAVLLTAMLGLVYALLRRTDAGISARQTALSESQERLAATLNSIGDGLISCAPDGKVTGLNPVAEKLTGWRAAEAVGRPIADVFCIINSLTRKPADNPIATVLQDGQTATLNQNTALIARDGSEYLIADSCAPIRDRDGQIFGAVLVFRDVTIEHSHREQIRSSEEQYRLLSEHAVSPITTQELLFDSNGQPSDFVIRGANHAFLCSSERTDDALIGQRASMALADFNLAPLLDAFGQVARTGNTVSFEHYWPQQKRFFSVNAYQLGTGMVAAVFNDITAHKENEAYHRLANRVLETLNDSSDFHASIHRILKVVKETTGCDAIGLRLEQHGDYPYFAEDGFPDQFLASENSLLACHPGGGICRHPDGTPILECICGLVISGQADANNALCTPAGSCWTNQADALLALPPDQDPRTNPRNVCMKFGFGSVMLVPIRQKNRIVGLLHLNTYKNNSYSLSMVNAIENIAAHIGEALLRKHAEEELRRQTQLQEMLMQISSTYISVPLDQADAAIETTLGELAACVHADQAYLFSCTETDAGTGPLFSSTHAWHAPGLSTSPNPQQNISLPEEWLATLSAGHPLSVDDVHNLPAGYVRNWLEQRHIRSLVAIPLLEDKRLLGLAGFTAVQQPHACSLTEIRLLTVFAQMLVNVSKRRETEEGLRLSQAQAEMANRAKSEFLSNMSHEIRTPMNAVIGMTDILLETHLDPQQHHFAKIVKSSAEALLGLLNDILDFSKMEAGKLKLDEHPFFLDRLLDDLAESLAVTAATKNLELITDISPDLPEQLTGDPGRLRQILTNLVGNAIKFTAKGEILIRVEPAQNQEEENEGEGENSNSGDKSGTHLLHFSVRDTGIGIPEAKIPLLFSKFTQIDGSATRQHGGTGLGLSISKQLAEIMGGCIGVHSQVGQGSTFWFTARLTFATATTTTTTTTTAPTSTATAGVKVLIVNDNPTFSQIIRSRLQRAGIDTVIASGPVQALPCLRQAADNGTPFTFALVDLQLPEGGGPALARAMQAQTSLATTRLIALSSINSQLSPDELRHRGFCACINKPLRQAEPAHTLNTLLQPTAPENPNPTEIADHQREQRQRFTGRAARILLAEDIVTNQMVLQAILKKFGLSADAVSNGLEALQALETTPYDLVLMDVQMPVMDGYAATRHIRDPHSAVLNHRIPIIAMTAHAMQGDREECLANGMNDYLTKPVSTANLGTILDLWLPHRETS